MASAAVLVARTGLSSVLTMAAAASSLLPAWQACAALQPSTQATGAVHPVPAVRQLAEVQAALHSVHSFARWTKPVLLVLCCSVTKFGVRPCAALHDACFVTRVRTCLPFLVIAVGAKPAC